MPSAVELETAAMVGAVVSTTSSSVVLSLTALVAASVDVAVTEYVLPSPSATSEPLAGVAVARSTLQVLSISGVTL